MDTSHNILLPYQKENNEAVKKINSQSLEDALHYWLRDELNSFKYFTQVTGAQIFAKHQFQLLNLNFTMKSTSFSIAILSFFSRHGLYFHPTKDQPLTRPTSTFFYVSCNFGQIFCTNVIQFFSVQNMDHNQFKR